MSQPACTATQAHHCSMCSKRCRVVSGGQGPSMAARHMLSRMSASARVTRAQAVRCHDRPWTSTRAHHMAEGCVAGTWEPANPANNCGACMFCPPLASTWVLRVATRRVPCRAGACCHLSWQGAGNMHTALQEQQAWSPHLASSGLVLVGVALHERWACWRRDGPELSPVAEPACRARAGVQRG
jgi:hypothetical protein